MIPLLRYGALASSAIGHFATTRDGGVSRGAYASLNLSYDVGDTVEAVAENRARLEAALGLGTDAGAERGSGPACLVCPRQVHGNRVAVVEEPGQPVGEADALVTATRGVCLMVLVADCVPILLHDPRRGAVGVVHAGWRGTVARVAERAVTRLREVYGTDPADLRAVLGPSIGADDYLVGPDVASAVREALPSQADSLLAGGPGDRQRLDLRAANRVILESAGLEPSNIEIAGESTASTTDRFYSHRAEGPTGRFAAGIWLR